MMRAKGLMLGFGLLSSFGADAETVCSRLIGSCEYYDCLEENIISCGKSGYSVGYGGRFCRAFGEAKFSGYLTQHEKVLFPSEPGQWLANTRQCLTNQLDFFVENSQNVTCDTLKSFAYDSHPDCYTGETSFCFLAPRHVGKIGTIIGSEIYAPETKDQMSKTAEICVDQIQSRLDAGVWPLDYVELSGYRDFWRLVAVGAKL